MAEAATILPPNATPFERAIDKAIDARWADLDLGILKRLKSPWDCPEEFLDFLAYEFSVDIWDDAWPVLKKRSVIARSIADHRMKGTLAGLRRYLEIADAELVQTVTPPQGFFASPDLSKAEWDALIAKHPKVRVTLARASGEYRAPNGIFADEGFVDHACLSFDDGWALLGRRAYLVEDGVETPLQLVTVERSTETRTGTVLERVVVPGKTANGMIADAGFADASFADVWDKAPAYYTYSLSRDYFHEESRLWQTAVTVGFEPRDMRFVRESKRGERGFGVFEGDFAGGYFATRDEGGELLADVLHLLDPKIAVPQVAGMSFANHSRVGMAHHTAEVLVDWKERMLPGSAFVADNSFVGRDPVAPADTARRAFVLNAVARASRASDRVRVTFQTRRDRTLGDGMRLDASARLGDALPNHL